MKVTTQAQLDKALADGATEIIIDSPAGVWLTLESTGSSSVEAWGSSSVVARDSSRVVARDSSRVVARDSSRVEAWGSSRVVARDSSRVVAWGSSRVEAWGSSRVEAWGSSSVVARGSSSVEASKYVAIHLHSKRVTLTGGVVIDVTDIDTNKVPDFIDYHGVTVKDGMATVYKAVDDNLNSGWHFEYPLGATVDAPDWKASQDCGNGLHFGYRPAVAKSYFGEATRFLECEVPVEGLIALGDKVKSKTARVVREVDIHGDAV